MDTNQVEQTVTDQAYLIDSVEGYQLNQEDSYQVDADQVDIGQVDTDQGDQVNIEQVDWMYLDPVDEAFMDRLENKRSGCKLNGSDRICPGR